LWRIVVAGAAGPLLGVAGAGEIRGAEKAPAVEASVRAQASCVVFIS